MEIYKQTQELAKGKKDELYYLMMRC